MKQAVTNSKSTLIEVRCRQCKRMLCRIKPECTGDISIEFKCKTCKRVITFCHINRLDFSKLKDNRIYI